MISSFTQTYSNYRSELYDFHSKDRVDINFRNKMTTNYFTFHNSHKNYIQQLRSQSYFKNIKNKKLFSYTNMNYTETLFETLNRCKKDGVKYLFFLQDDVFSLVEDIIVDELLLFIKNNDFDMLNIEVSNINTDAPIIYQSDNIKIYDTTSEDFKKKNLWAFDDGPYVARIDFLLNNIYDDIYYSKNDIWNAERYLSQKIYNNKIQRLTTNIGIFKRFGIVGPNAHSREKDLASLNEMFI